MGASCVSGCTPLSLVLPILFVPITTAQSLGTTHLISNRHKPEHKKLQSNIRRILIHREGTQTRNGGSEMLQNLCLQRCVQNLTRWTPKQSTVTYPCFGQGVVPENLQWFLLRWNTLWSMSWFTPQARLSLRPFITCTGLFLVFFSSVQLLTGTSAVCLFIW